MRPQFVVVSVCPNDFGDGLAVLEGKGDWFGEAEYWLDQIHMWCRAHTALCVLVPIPTRSQLEGMRRDDIYPGQVCKIFHGGSARYCDPLNEFIDEHLKLARIDLGAGLAPMRSALYNRKINDDHFSPRGAALWAEVVGRRLTRTLDPSSPEWTAPPPDITSSAPSSGLKPPQ
jgi:hypothetical protein